MTSGMDASSRSDGGEAPIHLREEQERGHEYQIHVGHNDNCHWGDQARLGSLGSLKPRDVPRT